MIGNQLDIEYFEKIKQFFQTDRAELAITVAIGLNMPISEILEIWYLNPEFIVIEQQLYDVIEEFSIWKYGKFKIEKALQFTKSGCGNDSCCQRYLNAFDLIFDSTNEKIIFQSEGEYEPEKVDSFIKKHLTQILEESLKM